MDSFIKNIEPGLYKTLLLEMIDLNIVNNKKTIEKHLRNKLNLNKRTAKHTVVYWHSRGWSENESYVKSKENKQKNRKSVYSREFWLDKINPATNFNYTLEEADFERNSRRPIRKEYWVKKGYSNEDALQLAYKTKSQNNKSGAKSNTNSNIRRVTSKRCTEYYTARGYTEEDAIKLVADEQRHFSKEICIKKHGEIKGLLVWQERQDQWQHTMNSKSTEEKNRIDKLKAWKGNTISKSETFLFQEIKKQIPFCSNQLTICHTSKKRYVYDIYFEKKIIEFHGDFWHCNPNMYNEDYIHPLKKIKAVDCWHYDSEKIKVAEQQGYKVLVVWEKEFKENKQMVINQCIQFLKQ